MAKLTLVRGIPGSGKSTLAKALAYSPDVMHLETDMFWMVDGEYKFDINRLREAHEWCQAETRKHLKNDFEVVVSNTFTTIKELRPYFDLAKDHGGSLAHAFAGTKTRFCLVSFTSDWLFPTKDSRAIVHALNADA